MKRKIWVGFLVVVLILTMTGCGIRAGKDDVGESYGVPPMGTGDFSPDDDTGIQGEYEQDFPVMKGTLTAGEWNDNKNFDFLTTLIETHLDWGQFSSAWQLTPKRRIEVTVVDADGAAQQNVTVELLDNRGKVLWAAKTDNDGRAYLFNRIGLENEGQAESIRLEDELHKEEFTLTGEDSYSLLFKSSMHEEPKLDLMFVVDTTGSMGDELTFLKTEMLDVIARVCEDHGNLDVRLSANVYRDKGDEYVLRSTDFTTDLVSVVTFLAEQYAAGGGDYEEAVELALSDAIYDHSWDEDATAKLLFLVLDAPPHNTNQNRKMMQQLMEDAAGKGIRIIPVASSGVDKNTEFLLRTMSTTTGGTYAFLTDHSGVGETHLEPTIGQYEVELLNDLMVRIIGEYLR